MQLHFVESNRFKAAPYCPCGRNNQDGKFAPIIVEGELLASNGHCHSCGKTFLPNKLTTKSTHPKDLNILPKKDPQFIDRQLVKLTLRCYHLNNFAQWLKLLYPDQAAYLLKYFSIGTTKDGGTIFWYRDKHGNYRKPKRIFYKLNGRRIKPNEDAKKHLPSPLKFTNQLGYEYCLFGEFQLVKYPETAKIMLVESEKTAVIGHAHYPEFIWLATGGATSLKIEKAHALKGRLIIILPDLHKPGREGAKRMQRILTELECTALILDQDLNREDGGDFADILVSSLKA